MRADPHWIVHVTTCQRCREKYGNQPPPLGEATWGPVSSEQLASNIQQAIVRSGQEQQAVAAYAEIDPTALSKILSGKRRVSALELALLSEATGVPVNRLLHSS